MHPDVVVVKHPTLPVAGGCQFRGRGCQQHPEAFEVFEWYIPGLGIDLMVEIGTGTGVFSGFLNEVKPANCHFVTLDIKDKRLDKSVPDFRVRDALSDETVFEIGRLIADSKSCLVLCDGGAKIEEVRTYAPLLRPGDLIMAHDYAVSLADFYENIEAKVWPVVEITEAHIASTVMSEGLERHLPHLFAPIVWGSWIKRGAQS